MKSAGLQYAHLRNGARVAKSTQTYVDSCKMKKSSTWCLEVQNGARWTKLSDVW